MKCYKIVDIDPYMIQILELAENNFKITTFTLNKEKIWKIDERQSILTENYNI